MRSKPVRLPPRLATATRNTPHPWHWDHREFRRLVQLAGFTVVHELAEPMTIDPPVKLRYFHYWVATRFTCGSFFRSAGRGGALTRR